MATQVLEGQSCSPSLEELIERARALRPLLLERAERTEAEGRVSAEVTQLLKKAGLQRLGQPKRFGGHELGLSAFLQVGFEVGRACPSTAWCTMIANGTSWMLACWPEEVQQDVWGQTPEAVGCSIFSPSGDARETEDSYIIEGQWPFASNCENTEWVLVAAFVPGPGGVGKEPAWFLVPMSEVEIDQNSWQVSGMIGTGSKTLFSRGPITVPKQRMVRFRDVALGTSPGKTIPGNVMTSYGFTTFGGIMLAAPILGGAQGALDWFSEEMRSKMKMSVGPVPPTAVSQNPLVQSRIGEAQAKIDAAMALLITDVLPLEAKSRRGEQLTVTERIRVRRDSGFAAQQAVQAINLLFEACGASAGARNVPIQRFWRDVNMGARHVTLDVQSIYGLVGQDVFGMEPKGLF